MTKDEQIKRLEKANISIEEYQNTIKKDLWLVSLLVRNEDEMKDIYTKMNIFQKGRKFNSNKIMNLLESRDKYNFDLYVKDSDKFNENMNFIDEVLNLLIDKEFTAEEKIKIISILKNHK